MESTKAVHKQLPRGISPATQNQVHYCCIEVSSFQGFEVQADVRDESHQVTYAGHSARNHCPTKRSPVERAGLVDNRSNTLCFDDAPDHKHKACNRRYYRLEGEEMPSGLIQIS